MTFSERGTKFDPQLTYQNLRFRIGHLKKGKKCLMELITCYDLNLGMWFWVLILVPFLEKVPFRVLKLRKLQVFQKYVLIEN